MITYGGRKMEGSPLFGKRISVNGDSICQGVGHPGGYVKIIAERNSMTYENLGIGGGTVATGIVPKSSADGKPRHPIAVTVDRMDPDVDYAIVEGGVNDASLNVIQGTPPIGVMTKGYQGPFDDSTFIGAFELMLKKLITKYHGKKIGYIAVHQCAHKFRPTYSGEDNFYRAAIKCCEKWGVPYLDLTSSVPMNGFMREKLDGDATLEVITAEYTARGDGTHPNEAGYLAYYCDRIEEWMKTL